MARKGNLSGSENSTLKKISKSAVHTLILSLVLPALCYQPCVTSLGCTLDVRLNITMHATWVCKPANYYLHWLRKIRNCLSLDICKLLVHTLVTVRLDYGNALLSGTKDGVIRQLERVQRQAARVVCIKIKYGRHTSVTELQWLPIRLRIKYKVQLLVY